MKGSTIVCVTVGVVDFIYNLTFLIYGFMDKSSSGINIGLMNVEHMFGFNTYGTVCAASCLFAILFIFGAIKERPGFIWPWLLANFHVIGNLGYYIVEILSHFIKGPIGWEILTFITIGITLAVYLTAWITVFVFFRRMFIADLEKSTKYVRSYE